MARKKITDADTARADLGTHKKSPEWRDGRHALPFDELGPDEFEVFCFLLLLKEHPTELVYYYGKTADGGRDLIHIKEGKTRFIQCKRYGRDVGVAEILEELAKLCVNVFHKRIPETPDEVVFYVAPDVTARAGDLIRAQSVWRSKAAKALKEHLKEEPSRDLLAFAQTWWPDPDYVAAISLTERTKKWPELLEEFFRVKHVISGSIEDVRQMFIQYVQPALRDTRAPSGSPATGGGTAPSSPSDVIDTAAIQSAFGVASHVLLSWPTTVGNDRWLHREELAQLAATVSSERTSTTLLLGAPGSGKSALLSKLGRQCADAGYAVLALKADTLGTGVDSLGKLSEELHLPALVTDCIRVLAEAGKLVVLIDQLDALADLVDLRSGRLNVLLTLIRQLSNQANVHIVGSCRLFEYGHDVRLTSVDADAVQLAFPTWEQVAEVLKDRGIDASLWPAELRDLLRTPQHLKIFLQRLRGTAEDRLFTTYQQLLDDLWSRCVTNADGPAGRSQLLMDMAQTMAERETIWLPTVRFEERPTLLIDLEAKGILIRSENGLSIGFQHQTLFEHARARAFAHGSARLAAYVLQRQDGLFVRPILWSSLHYLRGADPEAYQREMEALWQGSLRKHVRHLLVDFLGQLSYPPPTEAEQRWLIDYLRRPDFRAKVLTAVRGSPGWFSILAPSHFPAVMQLPEAEAWPMVAVLGAAWQDQRAKCLDLLLRHWVPEPAKDFLTWRTLEDLQAWDAEAAEVAERIVQRADLKSSAVGSLALRMAEEAPALGVHLIVTKLTVDLDKAETVADPALPPLPPNADEMMRLLQRATSRPNERFEKLLRDSEGWHDLPTLAEAAPQAFVEGVWPWLVKVVDHLLAKPSEVIYRYRGTRSLILRLRSEEEDERRFPVIGAIEIALRGFAQNDPAAFLSFLDREDAHDNIIVQRLLCRTLHGLVASHREACLQFLIADPRRLALGPNDDEHADTRSLITDLVPHLTDLLARTLEDAILAWCRYREDAPEWEAKERFDMMRRDRKHRLQLLAAFPLERLSGETQALFRDEQTALPDYEQAGIVRTWSGTAQSRMSAEQMVRAKDDDIVRLFTLLDQGIDSHVWHLMRGGMYEASLQFGQFAKTHPQRALSIIARFLPGQQELPAAYALDALSEDDALHESLFSLVLDLDRRGFRSDEFRVHAARALGACTKEGIGLPDALCALLEKWLGEPWKQQEEGNEEEEVDRQEERPHSMLWQQDGMIMLPFGTYSLLHTLTCGYLLRKLPAAEPWLRMLEAHVDRTESTRTWTVLSRDLVHLHLCDPGRVLAFLQRLFGKYPEARDSLYGAELLARVWCFVSPEFTHQALQAMRDGDWEDGPQTFGELLALRTLLYPEDPWAEQEVRQTLDASAESTTKLQRIRLGVGYTAAQLWRESHFRQRATALLLDLVPLADTRLSHAIMHVVFATDVLYADEPTGVLLRRLLEHPEILRATQDSFFVERLEDILSAEPELVFDICRELVRIRADELASIQTGFAANTSHLTNIALTLQRHGGDFRRKGLDLFEMLLDLGVQDAQGVLQELDKRPRNVVQQTRRKLQRRRRKA